MNAPHSENWTRRRNEIIDTAAALFAARGFHATSLAELCNAAELGRGAFYHYIQSKEELLELIHDRVISEVLLGARTVVATDTTALDAMRLLSRDLLRLLTTFPNHVFVHIHEFRALDGERAARFRSLRQEYEQLVVSVLEAGVRDDEFVIKDLHLTALAWLSLHNYIYVWYKPDGPLTSEVISETFSDIFIEGIRAR